MVEVEIDGKTVEVPEGSMVMEAAKRANTYIPHFCYHRKLSIAANCRMCLVDVEKVPKAVPACATPVAPGMIVRTKSEKAVKSQQAVMEFLLINHPLDCPICDQGGECQLQDLAVGYGKSASRYNEEKRVVFHKSVGPLISMQEMTRCIHCTRCVRFGQEIAGVMEFGMLGRGEHAEITTFVGATVDSEMSGNMIDLCPVGALTSKPFRFSARTWELTRRKSISPHDGTGANLIVQIKNGEVKRVLPLENEDVNECWISDKDRFSYEGVNSASRLTTPMIRQDGQWHRVDWPTALDYVADSLRKITTAHGREALGMLASPHSTLEELFLFKQLANGLGTPNVDHRLRQSDFRDETRGGKENGGGVRWLGMPIADLSQVDRALVVGAHLRRDQPLLASRLRQAARNGAMIGLVGASNDDALIASARRVVAPPSAWLAELSSIARAVAAVRGATLPEDFAGDDVTVGEDARRVAESFIAGEKIVVLMGNDAVHHPDFTKLHALTAWIAEQAGAAFGFLTEAANTVGAQLVDVLPGNGGLDAAQQFAQPRKAYVLLNTEPEFDSAHPAQALAALRDAELVVSLSAFEPENETPENRHYADVLLPIAPFTETAGAFVNCEGRVQPFTGVAKPLGDTRPAWKVLRVLGNVLGLDGFAFDTVEDVRKAALQGVDIAAALNNATGTPVVQGKRVAADNGAAGKIAATASPAAIATTATTAAPAGAKYERLADVPIYHADPLVRRAESLHMTTAARQAGRAGLPTGLFDALGLNKGDKVRVTQDGLSVTMPAYRDEALAQTVVRVSAATPASAALGSLFGELVVEKA